MKIKISFKQFIATVYDVCAKTLEELDEIEAKMRLILKVVTMVLMKEELEIEDTGTRDLGEKLLAADVIARLKSED
jgi:hypothetical protein